MTAGHFIDGELIAVGSTDRQADVFNPATGEVVTRVASADAD
jgi:acyl-CoA reductase-like NAD-dependent aldehyde dehydrogenase